MTVVYGNSSGGMKLLAPQLDRVDAELVGGHVEDALEHRGRLGPAGAAVRAHRRGVGERDRDVVPDLRDVVDALRHRARSGPNASMPPKPAYAPASPIDPAPHPDDRAVALAARARRTAPGRGRAASRPCSRSGSRPTSPAGRARSATRTAIDVLGAPVLGAERAADVRRDHAQPAPARGRASRRRARRGSMCGIWHAR